MTDGEILGYGITFGILAAMAAGLAFFLVKVIYSEIEGKRGAKIACFCVIGGLLYAAVNFWGSREMASGTIVAFIDAIIIAIWAIIVRRKHSQEESRLPEPTLSQIETIERTQEKKHNQFWNPCPEFSIWLYAYELYPKNIYCLFRFGDGEGSYIYTKSVDEITIKAVCADGAHTMLLRSREQRADNSFFQYFSFEKPVQKVSLSIRCGEAAYQTELNFDPRAGQKEPQETAPEPPQAPAAPMESPEETKPIIPIPEKSEEPLSITPELSQAIVCESHPVQEEISEPKRQKFLNLLSKKFPFKKKRFCSQCGGLIDTENKICTSCGTKYFKFPRKAAKNIAIGVGIIGLSSLLIFQYFYQNTSADEAQNKIKNLESSLSEKDKIITDLKYKVSVQESEIGQLNSNIDSYKSLYQDYRDKVRFMDDYIVIVSDDGTNLYHKYDCPDLDLTYFWAYNIEAACDKGYYPCPRCN